MTIIYAVVISEKTFVGCKEYCRW